MMCILYWVKKRIFKEMQPWTACKTRYRALLNEILNTTEIVEYGERYTELLDILREKTGSSSITLTSPFSYYFGFLTQVIFLIISKGCYTKKITARGWLSFG